LFLGGLYPWEIRRTLMSLLGESVIKDAESFFDLALDYDAIETSYLERKLETSSELKLEKEIKNIDPRRLQRIIRECDLLILVIATSGVSTKIREKVLSALSIRTKRNFMELYQLLEDISLPQLVDAQNSVIETMKKLRLNNDI
jgi:flagellar motor switch protein FliG